MTPSSLSKETNQDRLPTALYMIAWIVLSSSVIFFNKWVLYSCNFPYPIFLTTWHMLFAAFATRCLAHTTTLLDGRKQVPMTLSLYSKAFVPIGIMSSLSLICGNNAYLYLSVPFIQKLKASTPVAVLLITWAIGLRSANLKALANVLMIVAGVVIAPYGEAGFDLTGFTYQAAGIAFEATRISLIQKLLSSPEYKMDAIVSLYYFAPMSTAFNFLAFLIFEAGKLQLENILRVGPFVLSLNAVSAFALNVAVVLLIERSSGLVYSLCGILKDILLVAVSVIFLGTSVTWLQFLGYAIALLGLAIFKKVFGWDQASETYRRFRADGLPRWPRYPFSRKGLFVLFFSSATVGIMGLLYSSMLYPTNPDYEVPSALQNETTTGMISRPYLDHTYNPQGGMDLDIVVSMYKEDPVSVGQILDKFRNLEVFKTLNPRVLIYVKNKNANITMIKKRTGASSVELLPNKGREGGTYLHHILTEWDNLANHTLFIQGGVHEMKATMNRIQDFFMPKTGMLSLGFRHATCNCDSCKDPWTSPDLWPRVPEIYSAVYRETCQNNTSILISYAGQFLASAKRIRGTSKAIYKHLSDLVESDSEHWIHQDSHDARFFDTMDNPYFGHTIERSWMIVLQCSEPRLAERCQDLNLRRVEGDSDDICQCIDAE